MRENNIATDAQMTIKLTKGYEVLIDPKYFDKFDQFNWCACVGRKRVYAYRAEKGNNKKKVYLGRAVLEAELGRPLVKGEACYYLNGNSLDCRVENLSKDKPRKSESSK